MRTLIGSIAAAITFTFLVSVPASGDETSDQAAASTRKDSGWGSV